MGSDANILVGKYPQVGQEDCDLWDGGRWNVEQHRRC